MINPIDSVNGYANVFNNSPNATSESNVVNNQQVNDTVSINVTAKLDEEVAGIFNDIMGDLATNPTDLAGLHSGLNLDRVKALLSL